jgi:hypothetical protein
MPVDNMIISIETIRELTFQNMHLRGDVMRSQAAAAASELFGVLLRIQQGRTVSEIEWELKARILELGFKADSLPGIDESHTK